MTPAEVLAAAADKLDALADGASDGPWEVGSHHDMLYPGKSSWFLEGIERWRGMTNNVNLGEDEGTARYIAAMNPLVGKALVKILRQEAANIRDFPEEHQRFVMDVFDNPTIEVAPVLALARLIIGGES